MASLSASRLFRFVALIALLAGAFLAGRRSAAPGSAVPPVVSPAVVVPAPAVATTAPAAVRPATDEAAWHAIAAQPGSRARNEQLAQLITAIAARDPARALALVQAETNLLLRAQLRDAALRGWARVAPSDAARWALKLLDPADHEAALKAVFTGAVAGDPAAAIGLARTLAAEDVGNAVSYGGYAIDALCDAGLFDAAAHLAASGDPAQRASWLGAAYSRWAEQQPQSATQAALALDDASARNRALHGVIGGWSRADPAAATQFVLQLSPDPENSSLLSQSLERWAKVDLKGASDWINSRDADQAMDAGVAAVATRDYLPPDVAVSWAESVIDPKLRSETLVSVLRSWAVNDLPAAKRYFDATANLTTEDRQEIAQLLATLGGSTHG